jgi:hypothetical protein
MSEKDDVSSCAKVGSLSAWQFEGPTDNKQSVSPANWLRNCELIKL